jgi:hypothetical protein
MGFLSAVNVDENFWHLNPEIKYIQPFKFTYDAESSKDKEQSSKWMWAVYLYCDPDSRFARMEDEDKEKEIVENYLGLTVEQSPFQTSEFKGLIEAYKDKILSKLQKSYNRLLKKLEERDNFIAATKYTENNAKKLDDMFANSSKIYQQLKAIEDELETEKKSGNIKGGRKESLSERGII